MLSEKNVKFYMNANVTEVRGLGGKVTWRNTQFVLSNSDLNIDNSWVNVWLPPCHRHFFLQVKEIVLKSGDVIPADVLIVGIGECKHFFIIILMSLRKFSAHSLCYCLMFLHYQSDVSSNKHCEMSYNDPLGMLHSFYSNGLSDSEMMKRWMSLSCL